MLTQLVSQAALSAEVDTWVAKLSEKNPLALATRKEGMDAFLEKRKPKFGGR